MLAKSYCFKTCVFQGKPSICLPEGTINRSAIIQDHLQSEAHKECCKVEHLKKLTTIEKSKNVAIIKMTNLQRLKLANKIGSLIIHVYNDAKCLTLSAFSWPSRVVNTRLAQQFNFNEPFKSYSPSNFDFQYIRPSVVQELLWNIVLMYQELINK